LPRLRGGVYAYIQELVQDYTRRIVTRFDFMDECAFLRSLPEPYTFHGEFVQHDLGRLVLRCMMRDPEAIGRLVANTPVPQMMRDRLAGAIARLREHPESIRLV
jgi:hypothetical protein